MHKSRGVTLIELMVTLTVITIVLLIAVPSFVEFLAKRRIEGVAHELNTDLQYARSLAVNNRIEVTLSRTSSTQYEIAGTVIEGGAAVARTFKTMQLSGVTLGGSTSVSYEPHRGTRSTYLPPPPDGEDTPPTITVAASGTDATLTVSVTPMGQTQICSTGAKMGGYPECL
jgi:type IV fimbrial biogenesis protein FimT